jgi:apolipoprotein N-acyltransferase
MFHIFHPIVLLAFGLPTYVIGLGPALGSGLLGCVVARMTSRQVLRLALSPIVGALAGGPIYGLIMYVRYHGYEPLPWAQVMAAARGMALLSALVSLVCTVFVEWRGLLENEIALRR